MSAFLLVCLVCLSVCLPVSVSCTAFFAYISCGLGRGRGRGRGCGLGLGRGRGRGRGLGLGLGLGLGRGRGRGLVEGLCVLFHHISPKT